MANLLIAVVIQYAEIIIIYNYNSPHIKRIDLKHDKTRFEYLAVKHTAQCACVSVYMRLCMRPISQFTASCRHVYHAF